MVWFIMLLVLALWAAYVTCVHIFGGARRVVAPFRHAEVDRFSRSTMLVVWHGTTWMLLTVTATFAIAAFVPAFQSAAMLGALQALGFAIVFLVTARRELGASIRLPQSALLGPMALGALTALVGARHGGPVAAGALVAAIALGHLAWTFGAAWPARDAEQLAQFVLPGGTRLPHRAVTGLVAVGLAAVSASLFAFGFTGRARALALAAAVVFALRGLAGYVVFARSPRPFSIYDRVVYSPGCLFIAALVATGLA